MTSNIKEVEINLQNCTNSCKTIDENEEDSALFEQEIYDCNVRCLESNKEIMKQLEKDMAESIPRFKL